LSKPAETKSLKRKKRTQKNNSRRSEYRRIISSVSKIIFLYIAKKSKKLEINDTEPTISSDDETSNTVSDDADEQAIEEATYLENLKKNITDSHF